MASPCCDVRLNTVVERRAPIRTGVMTLIARAASSGKATGANWEKTKRANSRGCDCVARRLKILRN